MIRSRFAASAALALAGFGAASAPALAQVAPPGPPSQADISRARIGLPPPEAPSVDLRLQAPERAAVPRSIEELTFTVHRITVDGARAVPPAEAEGYFRNLLDRPINIARVRDAADRLQARYRALGYFLTRVFIPPQRIADGVLSVRVVEGRIGSVSVEGLDRGARRGAEATLAGLTTDDPARLAPLERDLLVLNDRPGITAAGLLRPGPTIGTSELSVKLAAAPTAIDASVANTNSDLLGPWVYAAGITLGRPAGIPGALTLAGSASGAGFDASQSVSGRYTSAIGTSGLIGSIGAIAAWAHPQGALRPLDIRNRLTSESVRLRYPIIRSRGQSLFVEAGFSLNRARTDALGTRIIADNSSVADVGLIYQNASFLGGSTQIALDVFRALPILGASGRDAPLPSVLGFDPAFTRATAAVTRAQPLGRGFDLVLLGQGQITGSKLPSGELVAFGGPVIGRGFDPSQITGDRGIGGSAELRWRIATRSPIVRTIQPYGFVDAAATTTLSSAFSPRIDQHLSSAGGGARFSVPHAVVDLSVAAPFQRLATPGQRGTRVLLQVTFAR